jgi:hypothetical protein
MRSNWSGTAMLFGMENHPAQQPPRPLDISLTIIPAPKAQQKNFMKAEAI